MGEYFKARLTHNFHRVCVCVCVCVPCDLLFRNCRTLDSFRFEMKFQNELKMLICCSFELELPMNTYMPVVHECVRERLFVCGALCEAVLCWVRVYMYANVF